MFFVVRRWLFYFNIYGGGGGGGGGSVSDRQIIEDSKLLDKSMFSSGVSIIADREIMVQGLFEKRNVFVNTPT